MSGQLEAPASLLSREAVPESQSGRIRFSPVHAVLVRAGEVTPGTTASHPSPCLPDVDKRRNCLEGGRSVLGTGLGAGRHEVSSGFTTTTRVAGTHSATEVLEVGNIT
jgi:hypothetical protein